jgi:pimeloyl-ACP methyl ester carboxylesterase
VPHTNGEMIDGVEVLGAGPRVVFVHGSVTNGTWLWAQQRPLADSFTLVIPNRSGYPPHEARDYIDFNQQADEIAGLVEDGTHLVGFSYGGIVALLAAERRLEALSSLTVVEPPALALARDNPDVERLGMALFKLYWSPPADPRAFLEQFMALIGGKIKLPPALPPDLEQGVRALMVERPPWDARFALEKLADAPFPKLVVSGGHHPALEAVCDVLVERLGAQRAVIPAGSHNIPQAGDAFNDVLSSFLTSVEEAQGDQAPD